MKVILPGWAKWLPFWGSVSEVGDAEHACFPCRGEVPVVGGSPVLGRCLVQPLAACKPECASRDGAPAKVPGASGVKCLCAVLLGMATWEAFRDSGEVPCNKVSSSKLTCLVMQVDVTCCSQFFTVMHLGRWSIRSADDYISTQYRKVDTCYILLHTSSLKKWLYG